MALIDIDLIGSRNERVIATVRPIEPISDILSWVCQWLPHMYDLSGRPLHDDSKWEVPKIWELINQRKEAEVLMLEAEDEIQGYVTMYLDYDNSSAAVKTYIPFLAVAPWNRMRSAGSRRYHDIGRVLVACAALKGFLIREDPSLELHSLPSAEDFYRKLKMVETGALKDNLKEFRLGKAAGFDLLRFLMPFIRRPEENK